MSERLISERYDPNALTDDEPWIHVALLQHADRVLFGLVGTFELEVDGVPRGLVESCVLLAEPAGLGLRVREHQGVELASGLRVHLRPLRPDQDHFEIHDFVVGVDFHWEHKENLSFQGELLIVPESGGTLRAINRILLESYLSSVISSEMSARCPPALLAAHAIISRSWLWAQIREPASGAAIQVDEEPVPGALEIRRWYDREDHVGFDVCADDHCQRYQGVTRVKSQAALDAVASTRGRFLVSPGDGRVCDARFSKCCGGFTERFAAAWGDLDLSYLQAFPDRAGPSELALPLSHEPNARAFIQGETPAFCNNADRELLERLLPAIDHETRSFYRWEQDITQDELRGFIQARLGLDPGPIRVLRALQRGASGRIVRLLVEGENRKLVVGKELEIRRLLSRTHLYSSAFVVEPQGESAVPKGFHLRGAGWGHGVGLCQIGAAVMAEQGFSAAEILGHYYRSAEIRALYP